MSLFSSRRKKVLKTLLWTLLFLILFSALWLSFSAWYYTHRYATLDTHLFRLQLRAQAQTTTILPADSEETLDAQAGQVHLYSGEHRVSASYDEFPRDLISAFVSIEDKRFYSHHGVDWKRTLGAVGGFLTGKSHYGGSTITQQLLKNVTGESEVSPARKLKEISRARQLEKHFSKEEILTLYLNTVYLSNHCYGVKTAAEYYFGCDVSELSCAQCASLAAIIQAPTKWDPIAHPEAHLTRRNTVLFAMRDCDAIDEETYQNALQTPLQTVAQGTFSAPVLSWYTEYVTEEATAILQKVYEMDEESARRFLFSGGFQIKTAQKVDVQQTLEEIYQNTASFPHLDDSLIQPQSSCVVLDPKSGAILGLIGAVGEKKENRILNYATQTKRPPGSAIKPLSVYAPAMQAGLINYATVYDDTPYDFTTRARGWPSNYPDVYYGLTPLHDAVRRSVNTVAVKVLADYGVEKSFAFLRDRAHLTSLLDQKEGTTLTDCALAPLALGQLTYGVSVLELTAGYTMLANGGVYCAPYAVESITDVAGQEIYTHQVKKERVLDEGNAAVLTQILKEVTTSGTASSMSLPRYIDTAGKTGTTTDDCDRWFVGYTKDYLAGVWFGYATPQPLDGFSETVSPAVSLWERVMTRLCADDIAKGNRRSFDTSMLVRTSYCRDSGKLPTASCLHDARGNRIEVGYFTPQQLPMMHCDCHIDVLYDTHLHGVAVGHSNPFHLSLTALIRAPKRDFPSEVTIVDAQYVYRDLLGMPPCPDGDKAYFAWTLPNGRYCGKSATDSPYNRAAMPPKEDGETQDSIKSP